MTTSEVSDPSSFNQWQHHLQTLWREQFPITNAMAIDVLSYTAQELVVGAQLAPNTNIHGTAFAGSLYSIQALTCWGMLYLGLRRREIDASIILSSSQIDYQKTVTADIRAHCRIPALDERLDELMDAGKLRIQLTADVVQEDQIAAQFSGDYAVRLVR